MSKTPENTTPANPPAPSPEEAKAALEALLRKVAASQPPQNPPRK